MKYRTYEPPMIWGEFGDDGTWEMSEETKERLRKEGYVTISGIERHPLITGSIYAGVDDTDE